jgi:CBS domain-containing protein
VASEPGRAAVETLIVATITRLRRHPPFDGMEDDALRFVAERISLSYHPKGSTILSPEQGEPGVLFIVQRGLVRLGRAGDDGVGSLGADTTLGEGECFSVGALLERRPTGSHYGAATDTFCYQLAAEDFRKLLALSPRFQTFATDYLTSLLRESRRLIRMHFSSVITEQQAMNRSLRSLIRRAPVVCRLDTPIAEALRIMHEAKIGSIVISGADGDPMGIFTRHDLVDRVVLAQTDITAAIATVMTGAPHTAPASASAYDAALTMAHHGIRHLPVIDEGKVVGVVTERDLFALQRLSMREIRRTIARGVNVDELADAARDIRRLASHMLEQGAAAEQLTEIVSTLNDALTRRLIVLERERHGLTELNWCWLAFGSEGRYEQTLATDQDNGLLFADVPGTKPQAMRERFLPFARAVNEGLDACGFPLCKGDIMAGNPKWCLSLAEWRDAFAGWTDNTDPQALLNSSIFFDFRPLYGSDELADALRASLATLTGKNLRFLRQLAEQALETRPPLGFLRDFVVEDVEGHEHTIDLKKSGTRVFVDAARVIALATATAHSSTAQRLRVGGARLNMNADEISSAVEAFFFIHMLRLKSQLAAGSGPGAHNRIDPDRLNEVDRRILKESFRQARKLQSRLALDYQL